ncbi:GGDEF domain-containing protein [Clostridium tetanomorphum]|nr:GGDEF domain-containing protein [Clostridium tetanomorphum]SQB92925.1 diguanylate cyclase domain-containing protein [Clostridium tetanomorphum]
MNNNKNLKPNFFIAVLDATFLLVFIYLNSQYLYTLMPILYVYILFQNIRFSKLNPLIFPSIVTIGGIFICKKLFINIFSIENVINIAFIYILALISHILISFIYKLIRQVNFMLEELHRKNKALEKLASKDYLTNMYTHRSFYSNFSDILKNLNKDSKLCMAMFDIDDFKKINDNYGHLTGDFILKEVSKIILDNLRNKDMAARYGGEEFAVLLPNTELKKGIELCENIRSAIENYIFKIEDFHIRITISCGISSLELGNISNCDQRKFIERVDKLLYKAKASGKNCVKWNTF